MTAETLVDSSFLEKLLGGSFEAAMGAVEEAVAENTSLFGALDETQVRVIGTYTDHVIVANREGEFYRCEWSVEGGGEVELRNVNRIDVPVVEAEIRQSAIREKYEGVISDLLECRSEEAESKLKELIDLAGDGVPMSAEAVEFVFLENRNRFKSADWNQMVSEKEDSIRHFVGPDALRLEYPQVRFESLTGDGIDESVAEARRDDVVTGLRSIRAFLAGLHEQTDEARTFVANGGSSQDAETVADFAHFASGFSEDLDGMVSIVDDAMAVSEDGCVKCLARLHDGIAGQMKDWAIAAAFAQKMARRFESTKAA